MYKLALEFECDDLRNKNENKNPPFPRPPSHQYLSGMISWSQAILASVPGMELAMISSTAVPRQTPIL